MSTRPVALSIHSRPCAGRSRPASPRIIAGDASPCIRRPRRRARRLVFLAERELEPRLIALLQHAERQHRVAERAAHVAEVVARALLADAFGLRHRVARAVRNSLASRASRSRTTTPSTWMTSRNGTSACGLRRLHQQEIRSQIAMPRAQHLRRRRRRRDAAAAAAGRRNRRQQLRRVLDVVLLGDDVLELVDEVVEIPAGAVEHDLEIGSRAAAAAPRAPAPSRRAAANRTAQMRSRITVAPALYCSLCKEITHAATRTSARPRRVRHRPGARAGSRIVSPTHRRRRTARRRRKPRRRTSPSASTGSTRSRTTSG